MMAKTAGQRFQTPAEVAAALAPFTRGSAAPAPAPVLREPAPAPRPSKTPVPVTPAAPTAVLTGTKGRTRPRPAGSKSVRRWPLLLLLVLVPLLAAGGVLGVVGFFRQFPTGSFGLEARGDTDPVSPPAAADGEGVLLVIPHQDFLWDDFEPVRRELTRNGAKVAVASSAKGEATPRSVRDIKVWNLNLRPLPGTPEPEPVVPDLLVRDARAADYRAVVFTGRAVPDVPEFAGTTGEDARAAQELCRQMRDRGKVVAGICNGTLVLADAGVLQGRRATGFQLVCESGGQLQGKGGCKPVKTLNEPVVVDGAIITAWDYTQAPSFAKKIYEAINQKH
jgi:putative intracellular protease/amidase